MAKEIKNPDMVGEIVEKATGEELAKGQEGTHPSAEGQAEQRRCRSACVHQRLYLSDQARRMGGCTRRSRPHP